MSDIELESINRASRIDAYRPFLDDSTTAVQQKGEQTTSSTKRLKLNLQDHLNPVGVRAQKRLEHKEEMDELVEALTAPSIKSPEDRYDRILKLIEDYQNKINAKLTALRNGEEVDFDALAQDVHTLLMLNLGKERENDKELVALSNTTIIILRDDIKDTTNTWDELLINLAGNGLMIVGGLGGASPILGKFCETVRLREAAQFLEITKDTAKQWSSISTIGQGVNGLGSIASNRNNQIRTVLQTNQELAKSAKELHHSSGQSSQQKAEQLAQLILSARERENQTRLAIHRQ